MYSAKSPGRSSNVGVSTSTNASRALSPSRSKSSSVPRPPSTSEETIPPLGVVAEYGIDATRTSKLTSPRTSARDVIASHGFATANPSLRASTPAVRKRASAQSTDLKFAVEPDGRPPISSVNSRRSSISGVGPNNAATRRLMSRGSSAHHAPEKRSAVSDPNRASTAKR